LFKIGYYNKQPEDERNPKPKAEDKEFKIDKSQLFKALMKDVRPKSAQQSTEMLEGDNPA